MVREQNKTTWYQHACAYIEMKWPTLAPKSRRSTVDALATVTPALVTNNRGAPDAGVLRRALYRWALNPTTWQQEVPREEASALAWLARVSLPVNRLKESDNVRAALGACARTFDGNPAAATTVQRKRAVLYNAIGYAVERDLLESNPIDRIQWSAPAVAEEVDRRVVETQPRWRICSPRYRPFTGTVTTWSPSSVACTTRPCVHLKRPSCASPIATFRNRAGGGSCWPNRRLRRLGVDQRWHHPGEARTQHRASTEVRPIPIPPELVVLLRRHIDRFRPRRTAGSSVDRGAASSARRSMRGSGGRPGKRSSRLPRLHHPSRPALRPTPRRCFALAQRWRTRSGGRPPCWARGRGPAQGLCRLHRRRGAQRQRPHRRSAQGQPGAGAHRGDESMKTIMKGAVLLVNGMIEASEFAHLKTAMAGDSHRGFESHALRSNQLRTPIRAAQAPRRPLSGAPGVVQRCPGMSGWLRPSVDRILGSGMKAKRCRSVGGCACHPVPQPDRGPGRLRAVVPGMRQDNHR